jgi:hypothetical protein
MENDIPRRKARAARARVELDLTQAAFAAMRANAIEAWLATPDHDTTFREALYRSVKVIDTVREHLLAALQDGEVAAFAEEVSR